ncbi:Signal transduction histidine kinase [Sinosporangium album]|uniref:Signal transduction histidine-protein kinase/phosphatase MprB n=1 Tax=Sinosporangium album TaxID=504805 RepID=A0A1G7S334_9ACTN|nr:HAMP domain-containing sensor histidine kinase [Sinosporangium album]SDG17381.1 Signal transduction histidine kinase [Sinosporangium album]
MRRRLALLVAATTSLVLISLLVPLAFLVHRVAENRAFHEATGEAEAIAVQVGTIAPAELAGTVERSAQINGHPVTVFLSDGTLIGSPANRSPAVELASRGRSVTAQTTGGWEVLVAVKDSQNRPTVVRAFLSDDDLRRGVYGAWTGLLFLGLILIGLGVVVADRLALALTRPMDAIARVSHRLAAGDLTARTEPDGPPEMQAVGVALNGLADRINDLLAQERENAADLSHRLRTPLTGLRLDAEALCDVEEAAKISARVDALERAVTAVITEARQRTGGKQRCDAAAVVRERVTFWSVLAEDQARELTVDLAPGPLHVAVSAGELTACVDALLGNVFAHTPEGAAFAVRLTPADQGALLEVADHGPGFRRVDPLVRGESGAGSSGLGMDIVRRTAESSGGSITLGATPGGGATVSLVLGRPATP